jgi:hypothetical protein
MNRNRFPRRRSRIRRLHTRCPDPDLVDFTASVYASYDRWMTGELTKLERRWHCPKGKQGACKTGRRPTKTGTASTP